MRILGVLFLAALPFGAVINAQLDPTFGSGGKVHNPTGRLATRPKTVTLPDNKILIADRCHGDIFFTPPRLCFIRLNENGSLDTFQTTAVPGISQSGSPWAHGVAYQNDGKILVAGGLTDGSRQESVLIRYNSDGSLDTSFGTNGFVINEPAGTTAFNDIVIQDDGKLVVSGINPTTEVIVRFDQNGILDPSFGQGGTVNGAGKAIVMLPDARLLAAGSGQMLTRLKPNGSFDTTFGDGDGQVNIGIAGKQVAFQADGRILVLTDLRSVHRFNADGAPDLTFNGSGSVSFYDFNHVVTGMSVTPSGKVTIVGYRWVQGPAGFNYEIARVLRDGTPDMTFSGDGFLTLDIIGGSDAAYSITYDSNGRSVIGGISSMNSTTYQDPLFSATRLIGPPVQNVVFAGKIVRSDGRAVSGATISLRDGSNLIATARSNSFGFFNFFNIPTGKTYKVSASSKVATFREHNILVDDTINSFIFTGQDPWL